MGMSTEKAIIYGIKLEYTEAKKVLNDYPFNTDTEYLVDGVQLIIHSDGVNYFAQNAIENGYDTYIGISISPVNILNVGEHEYNFDKYVTPILQKQEISYTTPNIHFITWVW